MKQSKQESKARILKMSKKRFPGKSISPTEVTKDLFSDVWKGHVDEVRTTPGELQSEKLTNITRITERLNQNK